jgi:hypothetical protein
MIERMTTAAESSLRAYALGLAGACVAASLSAGLAAAAIVLGLGALRVAWGVLLGVFFVALAHDVATGAHHAAVGFRRIVGWAFAVFSCIAALGSVAFTAGLSSNQSGNEQLLAAATVAIVLLALAGARAFGTRFLGRFLREFPAHSIRHIQH